MKNDGEFYARPEEYAPPGAETAPLPEEYPPPGSGAPNRPRKKRSFRLLLLTLALSGLVAGGSASAGTSPAPTPEPEPTAAAEAFSAVPGDRTPVVPAALSVSGGGALPGGRQCP